MVYKAPPYRTASMFLPTWSLYNKRKHTENLCHLGAAKGLKYQGWEAIECPTHSMMDVPHVCGDWRRTVWAWPLMDHYFVCKVTLYMQLGPIVEREEAQGLKFLTGFLLGSCGLRNLWEPVPLQEWESWHFGTATKTRLIDWACRIVNYVKTQNVLSFANCAGRWSLKDF